LAFFAPDITEVATNKRVAEFDDGGVEPLVLSFRRQRCNRDFEPSWPYVALGRTGDGRHWQRVWAMVLALPKLLRAGAALKRTPIYYARNLDLLLLALLARRVFNHEAAVAYEVLDIQPAFLAGGWRGGALRAIERWCLRRVALLVLSSPGFLRHYYRTRQGYAGPWLLLENKLHRSALPDVTRRSNVRGDDARGPKGVNAPWVIGYFGLIRGEATMRLVHQLAIRLPQRVVFRFAGVFTTVEERRFRHLFARLDNVVYDGEYAHPRDLGTIYRAVDFAWAIDLEDSTHNSRWLLPNRYYEAGACGVPCLAVAGFELGAMLDRLGVGWTFEEPLEDALVHFFETLDASAYTARRARLAALPQSCFVAGEDVAALHRALLAATGACVTEQIAMPTGAASIRRAP
jgi:succinoglycan biosynthesis protein ExoL